MLRSPLARERTAVLPSSSIQTGSIWNKSPGLRDRTVRNVCKTLNGVYGRPRLGNPTNPLDDLVFIILSNKTGPRTARRIYKQLRERFRDWEALLRAPISEVRRVLKPAGLSSIKSKQLRAAFRSIKNHCGACDLNPLRGKPAQEVEAFLVGLPGVSEKVAKCVMMYTMDSKVLPVDVHVHRVSRRLGWTTRKRADQCHEELESLVPPEWRYAFHVDCVLHGRRICRPHEPICGNCCIRSSCEYFKKKQPTCLTGL